MIFFKSTRVCATMCLNERCAPVNFARFRPCAASTVKEKVYSVCEPVPVM